MRPLISVFVLSTALVAQTITVPQGKPIMLDGKLSAGEWSDARQLQFGAFARLYCKQNNNDVLLAIQLLESKTGTVDLYLSSSGKLYDLHASAKLGERTLENGRWPEEWNWWNNEGWVASVSRPDDWSKPSFKDETVREFQLSRNRFPGKEWKIFVELITSGEAKSAASKWKTSRFPAEASNASDKDWITLRLQ